MKKLATHYLGLELETPFIIASSGISKNLNNLKTAESLGAGAVVIKSLFEEQISFEANKTLNESPDYPEAADYIRNYSRHHSLNEYLDHIKLLKKELKIPVIASINCTGNDDWTDFASKIEKAGADALELNMNVFAFDTETSSSQIEENYFNIIDSVKNAAKINIAAKLSQNFTSLPYFVKQLNNRGVNSFVMFNKYFAPIINTDKFEMTGSAMFSESKDIKTSLRMIAVVSGLIKDIDISGSTGVYDYDGAAQLILAGASSVQLCSVLYRNGVKEIGVIKREFEQWMDKNGFNTIEEFKARLSYKNIDNPKVYERFQFMKHVSSIE
jgi:dihydroorotate dehydrogenase (fumarate)